MRTRNDRPSVREASAYRRDGYASRARASRRRKRGGGCLRVFLAGVTALVLVALGIFAFFNFTGPEGGKRLPSYITDEMVQVAMDMEVQYGHPAACTIAQIIQESGSWEPSALAARDNNLFGMKWSDYFAGYPGVVGPVTWETNEEYDGEVVGITGTFMKFTSMEDCIRFRSSAFLQSDRYEFNPLIMEAIATGSSDLMADGLQDAGWATDSNYAASLKRIMERYDLYRFDRVNRASDAS